MKCLKETHTHTKRGHAHKHALIHTHRHRHTHEAARKRDTSTESQWPVTPDLNACQYKWTAEQLFFPTCQRSQTEMSSLCSGKSTDCENTMYSCTQVSKWPNIENLKQKKKKRKIKKSRPSPLRSNGKLQDTCLGRWSLPLNLNSSRCKRHRYPHLLTALPVRNRVVPPERGKRRQTRKRLLCC